MMNETATAIYAESSLELRKRNGHLFAYQDEALTVSANIAAKKIDELTSLLEAERRISAQYKQWLLESHYPLSTRYVAVPTEHASDMGQNLPESVR